MIGTQSLEGVRRYQIEDLIGSGGMGMVYRAFDRLTGRNVAFKHVRTPESSLLFTTVGESIDYRRALAQEFKTLASLRHPNIIAVLDYGFDEKLHPYFTMELLDNPRDILQAGAGQPFETQLDLMVQTLQALLYLHRRDIIHRDLKPDNVLVVDKQVKVLDFGLAVQREIIESQKRTNVSGTLPYLAPEVLQGERPSKESDLYAVGMMAYEMFSGNYPFPITSVNDLIDKIIHVTPDISALNLDNRVADVLTRMLAKSPQDRFSDAGEILAIYVGATGRVLGVETSTTRESFLQAAKFIGREAEFALLVESLRAAIDGVGSAWLVGGESGVGKSRLLEELRTQALIDGALVLRGQAIVQGGIPYTLWRDVLRTLCLQVDLSDREASVLKSLVPDIGFLLGRNVSDAPELDPQGNQNRLLMTIEEVFARQTRPVVAVLEDLQWADAESLELLRRLSRTANRYPLMLVASFRNDERADLTAELPDMKMLKLLRLDSDQIANLSASMLGEEIGRQPHVMELLERETEGNIFFIVEVVRALAEESGQLGLIGHQPLPERVFAGGMKAVVLRRLNRVPANAQMLLNVAAVAGRQLDLRLLGAISPEANLSSWLADCSNAAVLEVQDEQWRFAHDKLREGLIEQLSVDQRRALHRQVAEATESVYPGEVIRAAVLAYHWHEVGDEAKEAHYLAQAGEHALTTGAYKDAQHYLSRAEELYQRLDVPAVQRAQVNWLIGRTRLTLGQLNEAKPYLEQALAYAGYPVPSSSWAMAGALLKEIAQQVFNRLRTWATRRPIPLAQNLTEIKIVLRASESLAEINYYANNHTPTVHLVIRGLNLAEKAGPVARSELVRFYSSFTGMMMLLSLERMRLIYKRLTDETMKDLDDPDAISWLMLSKGTQDSEWSGELEASVPLFFHGMELAEQMGHSRRWQENATQAAKSLRLLGQVQKAIDLSSRIYTSALEQNNLQGQEWAMLGQSQCYMVLHQYETALDCLRTAGKINQQIRSVSNLIEAFAVQGLISLLRDDRDTARACCEQVRALLGKSAATSYRVTLGFASVAAYALDRWEYGAGDDHREWLRWALKGMKTGARQFIISMPRYYAYLSWQNRLAGKNDQAYVMGEKALAEAQRLKMPYEQALALYMLAQIEPKRPELLSQAEQILREIGVDYDLTKDRLL